MPREWNSPSREPWNPIIKTCLNAIDRHVDLYLRTGNSVHLTQAAMLREYVSGLKEWIRSEEEE